MSSYVAVDANRSYRHRYYAPRRPRREAVRIKAGRVVIVLVILLVAGITAAYGGGRTGAEQVTVQPGQTVWSIAADRYPDDDTRGMVGEIVKINNLGDAPLYAGEKIQVPAR
jgi:hypothetical protein